MAQTTNNTHEETYEEVMLQIQETLVSLDLIERYFCCDLDKCLGECCIEGDAGAPVTEDECREIERILPEIKDELMPAAQREINEHGVAYIDEEGDLVTTIVDGRNCAFSCYAEGGKCICAIERAYRQGRIDFMKPSSCHLYPVRLNVYPTFTAVNFHRWKICKCAEVLGRKLNLRAYQFLKDPLTRRFGKEWYDELCEAAEAYLAEYGD
jgi:hypothetical protein